MGRRLAIAACALACPLSAAAAPPKKPVHRPLPAVRPTLTLKAPAATAYRHTIDLVGRLTPSRPGTRITLTSRGFFVGATALRRDGTYRFTFAVGTPGPFQAHAGRVASKPATVEIVPTLQASLQGSRGLGQQLKVVATLVPAEAGRIQVRVERQDGTAFLGSWYGAAGAALPTASLDPYDVRVTTVAKHGYRPLATALHVELVPPTLSVGMTGPAVAALAHRLADLHYLVPSFSEDFGYDLVESVYAFQKVEGLPRTGQVDATVWERLQRAAVPEPRYREPGDHLEVDKARQVLFVVRDGEVQAISPVSTAGLPGRFTPVGTFSIYRKVVGYDTSPLGVLLNPMYFVGGYAIHGNPSVPPYPASHGCVRVPNFVIYRIFDAQPYGETVDVY